jgi:hypothetical protein
MENQEFDRNEWQGKRRDQVKYSETVAIAAMLAAIAVIVFTVISKIFF